jgi:hypothetical protein
MLKVLRKAREYHQQQQEGVKEIHRWKMMGGSKEERKLQHSFLVQTGSCDRLPEILSTK